MRTLIDCNLTSLDGNHEGPGYEATALFGHVAANSAERPRAAAPLPRRGPHDGFAGFRPRTASSPAARNRREIPRLDGANDPLPPDLRQRHPQIAFALVALATVLAVAACAQGVAAALVG